jgi:quinol monooxygenase YgiN
MMTTKHEEVTIATARLTVPPHSRKEFFQSISTLADHIRGDRGCLSFRLYEESGDENSFILIEEWESRGHWAAHRNGANFAVLLGVISVLSIVEKIDFKLLSRVGGNEVIRSS